MTTCLERPLFSPDIWGGRSRQVLQYFRYLYSVHQTKDKKSNSAVVGANEMGLDLLDDRKDGGYSSDVFVEINKQFSTQDSIFTGTIPYSRSDLLNTYLSLI